jgi:large exoprotein involved in heme utilization and adhesion
MANITLSQGATLDVSGNSAGTIAIRGGQFVIVDATISADTGNINGAPTAVDIQVTGDMSISDTRGVPAITARSVGDGNAGAVRINSANLVATSISSAVTPFALIDTHTSGVGRAGNVSATTGNLQMSYQLAGVALFIDSGTAGAGHGGDVAITAQNVALEGTGISTGDFTARTLSQDASGSAGNVTITTDSLQLTNTLIDTGAFLAFDGSQHAGNVTINARDISMTDATNINAQGFGGGGSFTIHSDTLVMNNALLESDTVTGPGGGITINARTLELGNGSQLVSTTVGDGKAGDIRVTGTDHVSLSTNVSSSNPSGFFSNSTGDIGSGPAGAIVVTTPRLDMTGGSRINTVTLGSGRGGDVTINATNTISISGEFPSSDPEPIFGIGTVHPSGIFTKTAGSDLCVGPCGDAGHISITTGSLILGSGAQIDSGTSNSGRGGNITINAANQISMFGTLSDGSPVGIFSRTIGTASDSEAGGNIALTAGQSVTLTNGSSVSASSTGPGNTGNIQINAGNQFAMTNSSVTTQASQAGGGTIKITTDPGGTVQLTNSTISASVLDGTGGGGSVNIDPQFVILQGSQILAQAVQGSGGNISITTNLLLPDANSVISASSQFGVNGTVTIQSPNAPASGHIQPLGATPLQATSLLNQRCASLAGGEFSSFTVAGRDSLPTEPGSWLASPLATLSAGTGLEARGEGRASVGEPAGETPLLSLRQIAPAGFLTQGFAVDWSASCQS